MRIHGLKNCDTCKKALAWARDEGITVEFRDVRADAVSEAEIRKWVSEAGWETLLNRRGTTWRGLAEAEKADMTEGKAVKLMAAHPALIKRPVFETDAGVIVGFGKGEQAALRTALQR